MVYFHRAKNLKDHLVRSKLQREEEAVVGMFKCGKKKCKICDNVVTDDEFKSYVEGRSVVYLISGKSCGLQRTDIYISRYRPNKRGQ